MDVTFGLVFLGVFLLSWFVLRKRPNLPPGPLNLPFVGAVPFFVKARSRPAYEYMLEASKHYGDIFSFWFGSRLVVVINGYDLIHQTLVKQSGIFSDRPNSLISFKEALRTGKGIILEDYNHKWKTMRRFTLQSLRDFGVGKTSLEEKINDEIAAMAEVFVREKGNPIDINLLLQRAVGNVIYGIVFGKRFDYEDKEFGRIRDILTAVFEGPGLFHPINFFPGPLVKLLKGENQVEVDLPAKQLRDFISEQIKMHEDTYDENSIRDFIDYHIQCSKSDTDAVENGFTKGNLMRVIMDLFVAGSDTTSTTLTWAFLFMSEYPDVQTKCQEEIHEICGDKVLEYSDREKLVYVEATLREIQRLSNTVPLSLPHVNSEDTTIAGYDIPKNTILLPNLASCSMDERHWTNPSKFDPGRFLNANNKLVRNDALAPFSLGPRSCVGEPLARMELFLIFSSTLQHFTFCRENDSKPHSFRSLPTTITNLPERFKLRVLPRSSPSP